MNHASWAADDPGAASTVESCYAAGMWVLERGDTDAARSWLARCAAAPGGDADARCALLAGAIATEEGDFAGAARHYRRAADLAPDDLAITRQLAETLSAAGAFPEAIRVLEDAAGRHPEDADTLVDLGYIHAASGDPAGARAALERAARARPGDAAIQRALGEVYEAAGEPARAANAYAAAGETLAPRTANDLARLYLQLERYPEAEAVFRRLRATDPDGQLVAQHGLTWCRIKEQDWRGAFDTALGATRLDRYGLTTAFLAYARDRLFGRAPDAAAREADLAERFAAELREHYELHSGDGLADEAFPAAVGEGGERG
ncbi:MAG TPA: tetratricopeptide repeat protein [Thermomicrobiales bacterium]|nr:tetratricopeptide repeat protein [Thermomicrobiales bacterium]